MKKRLCDCDRVVERKGGMVCNRCLALEAAGCDRGPETGSPGDGVLPSAWQMRGVPLDRERGARAAIARGVREFWARRGMEEPRDDFYKTANP